MTIGELAIMRRIALVAACCSTPWSRSRLSCLLSRTSLAFASLRETLRFLDGGRLVVGISYRFWFRFSIERRLLRQKTEMKFRNPNIEIQNKLRSNKQISNPENPKRRIQRPSLVWNIDYLIFLF